jgi:hypothetical protein
MPRNYKLPSRAGLDKLKESVRVLCQVSSIKEDRHHKSRTTRMAEIKSVPLSKLRTHGNWKNAPAGSVLQAQTAAGVQLVGLRCQRPLIMDDQAPTFLYWKDLSAIFWRSRGSLNSIFERAFASLLNRTTRSQAWGRSLIG